jgi:regulatory protein
MCLRWLTDRAHTRAELASKLAAKGIPEEIAERVLDRYTEVGLINDAVFADNYTHSRLAHAGKGSRAIARELRTKGVPQEEAERALEGINEDEERERARELVRQRLTRMDRSTVAPTRGGAGGGAQAQRLAQQKQARQLAGMLERRGFPSGIVFSVVREELAAHDAALDMPED